MSKTVANHTNDAHTPVGDAPVHPIAVEHIIGGPMGRPAALMLTEDGQVLITFDARMEEDEMNAAFLKVMEAARTLL